MELERLLPVARFRATSFGVVNAGAPCGVEAPDIDYAIIYSVVRGPIWFEGGGLSETLNSGDVLFLPHGDRHRLASSSDVAPLAPLMELLRRKPGNFIFNHGGAGAPIQFIAGGSIWEDAAKTTISRLLPEALILRKEQIPETGHIADVTGMVVKEGLSPRTQSGIIVNELFNILLFEILNSLLSAHAAFSGFPKNSTSGKITRALLLIHNSSPCEWTSTSLAERVGLSRSVFSKKFKLETGVSPGAYIKRLRMQRAANLLEHPHVSIADAAEHAGYASIPSFSQAFKLEFGASPHAWRISIR
ncbi:AraC family transcriptional regulator [Hyphococcus sp.]|uniref:AraC family transcriptional regulator n=1 Tax=Hyphococcus sp. TaxID=2038636 RepID=UPI003CCBD0B6